MPPIAKGREGRALLLFVVQFLCCLALVGWYEVSYITNDGFLKTLIAIGQSMGRLVVFITATTIMIIEGYPMLAERFLKNRYNEGKAEGFKEGYEKAKKELAQGQANNNPPAQQPSEESPKQ